MGYKMKVLDSVMDVTCDLKSLLDSITYRCKQAQVMRNRCSHFFFFVQVSKLPLTLTFPHPFFFMFRCLFIETNKRANIHLRPYKEILAITLVTKEHYEKKR